jgi:TctA family transporter
MKKQPELSSLSIEELEKRAKTTKFAASFLLGVILLQLCIGIYLTIKNGFNVFITLPFAFLPLVILIFNELKKIKTELEKRKS